MRKTFKMLILSILIILVMLFSMGIISNATNPLDNPGATVDKVLGGGTTDTTGIETVGANIASVITTVGIVVAVIVLLILGVKYMMGSASEKAEYKKTMIPYLVGAALIFGASTIAKAVIAMTKVASGN